MSKHGKIFERTKYDPNKIIVYEDYAEVILYNKKNNEIARALIDRNDIEKVREYRWCKKDEYVYSRDKHYKNIPMHRLIMGATDGFVVDHINHNPLDNRRSNLRICTSQQNVFNTSITTKNKSGFKGVRWNKKVNKWIVYITFNGQRIHLGVHVNIEDAIAARKKAEEEYFGEFRYNHKTEDTKGES